VRGKERELAVLDEARLDTCSEVIRQQRLKIAPHRRHLLDARAQRRECVGAAQQFGHRLRVARLGRP